MVQAFCLFIRLNLLGGPPPPNDSFPLSVLRGIGPLIFRRGLCVWQMKILSIKNLFLAWSRWAKFCFWKLNCCPGRWVPVSFFHALETSSVHLCWLGLHSNEILFWFVSWARCRQGSVFFMLATVPKMSINHLFSEMPAWSQLWDEQTNKAKPWSFHLVITYSVFWKKSWEPVFPPPLP